MLIKNSLSSLNVAVNTKLKTLIVNTNQLSSLNVAANTELATLFVHENSSLTCIRADASQLAGGDNEITTVNKEPTRQTLSVTCP